MLTTLLGVKENPNHPIGQAVFLKGDPSTFTVPDGVTRISIMAVGPGAERTNIGNSFNAYPTIAGGSLVYMNDVAVSPGQVITLNVGIPSESNLNSDTQCTRIFGIVAGPGSRKTVPPKAVGYDGGAGPPSFTQTYYHRGGGAARLTGRGIDGGVTQVNSDFYPFRWNSRLIEQVKGFAEPQDVGGGSVITDKYAYLNKAGSGGIRIIWGNGRAFPDKDIGDMVPSNTWETLSADTVPATKNGVMFSHNTSLYLVTGDIAVPEATNQLWKYETIQKTWTKLTCPLVYKIMRTVSVVNGKAYFFGGYPNFNQIWIYDINADTWERTVDYPIPFYSGSSIANGTDIYIIGGYNDGNSTWVSRVTKFNTLTNTMSNLKSLPTGLNGGVTAIFNGQYIDYMLAMDSSGNIRDGFRYEIATDTWKDLPKPTGRLSTYSCIAQNETNAYIFFGSVGNNKVSDITKYNGAVFTNLAKPAPQPVARSRTQMARVDRKLYLYGGEGATSTLQDFWSYMA